MADTLKAFVCGQDAESDSAWASSFSPWSLICGTKDQERREREASCGPGVTGTVDRVKQSLLLMAVDLVRPQKSCSSLESAQISVSMRSRGTQEAMRLALGLAGGTALAYHPWSCLAACPAQLLLACPLAQCPASWSGWMGGERAGSEAGGVKGRLRAVGCRGTNNPQEAAPRALSFCQGASERPCGCPGSSMLVPSMPTLGEVETVTQSVVAGKCVHRSWAIGCCRRLHRAVPAHPRGSKTTGTRQESG